MVLSVSFLHFGRQFTGGKHKDHSGSGQPNWPVSGSANRLKKAVAEVNRLWIQTPASTSRI